MLGSKTRILILGLALTVYPIQRDGVRRLFEGSLPKNPKNSSGKVLKQKTL